jgi:hypothetical protein
MWWRRLRWFLILAALCAIATCPSARRSCTAKNQAREADDLLGVIASRVAHDVAVTGKLPMTPAGPTPVVSCCEQGGVCKQDFAVWDKPGWRELGFSIDGDYRYAYQYAPDPSGKFAIVRATGDLDCDGVSSLYEVKLTVVGTLVQRSWRRVKPYE